MEVRVNPLFFLPHSFMTAFRKIPLRCETEDVNGRGGEGIGFSHFLRSMVVRFSKFKVLLGAEGLLDGGKSK